MDSYWQDLAWDWFMSIFEHLYQSYGPWFKPKLCSCSISWEWISRIFTKFYICIHIDKIYFGIVAHHFSHICTRVLALDLRQNFVSIHFLENKWTEFHLILYILHIDKIYIVTHHFPHDLSQNFAVVQYLENKWTKGVRELRGYFAPPPPPPPLWGQKIKVTLHKFLLISLLEQKPKCKSLVLIQLLRLLW